VYIHNLTTMFHKLIERSSGRSSRRKQALYVSALSDQAHPPYVACYRGFSLTPRFSAVSGSAGSHINCFNSFLGDLRRQRPDSVTVKTDKTVNNSMNNKKPGNI